MNSADELSTEWSTLPEHRMNYSLFNGIIETQRQMDLPTVLVNTARAQSNLSTIQWCHWDSQEDSPPVNTVIAQSDLFTVQ